jgi:hypothetical protein
MAMTLITTNTSSDAASSSFTSGIDSTYKLYIFKFYDINPATDATFSFQVNATDDPGGDYDQSLITSTFFVAGHEENDNTFFNYVASMDQAQGAAFQPLAYGIRSGADESCAGTLHLFNPSSTTYVKHFYSRANFYGEAAPDGASKDGFAAGYINDTTAIDDIQFKMSSGNMDAVISMYGVG